MKTSAYTLRLLPYQKAYLKAPHRLKIACWARQTGKTYTHAVGIVSDILDGILKGDKNSWLIISVNERSARMILNDCIKPILFALNRAYHDVLSDKTHWKEEEISSLKAYSVVFCNGASITALPANAEAARGYTRNVYLDEFAHHHKSHDVWKAVYPVTSHGKKCWISSTPAGLTGRFSSLFHTSNKAWFRSKVNIYQAVEMGLDLDIEHLRSGCDHQGIWKQEFEVSFLSQNETVFEGQKVKGAQRLKFPPLSGGRITIGVDVGRRNHLFCIAVVEQAQDIFWVRKILAKRNLSFQQQQGLLIDTIKRYSPIQVFIDQGGMGEMFVEEIQRKMGESCQGFLFTHKSKQQLFSWGRRLFEEDRIRLPDDNDLFEDIMSLKETVSATGQVTIIADSGHHHADRTIALMLALWGFRNPPLPYEFLTLKDKG